MDGLRTFLDTNLLLDVLLIHQPFAILSRKVWEAHDADKIEGFVSALSLATLFYLSSNIRRKELGYSEKAAMREARKDVQICLTPSRSAPSAIKTYAALWRYLDLTSRITFSSPALPSTDWT
jgi:predicted nucleic acid-binding protein